MMIGSLTVRIVRVKQESTTMPETKTQEVSASEAIQSLVNQVAQLKHDNNELMNRLTECRAVSNTTHPMLDSSPATLVTPFSGKPSEDIEAFFADVLAAAKLGFWTDEQLLQMTKLRLIGEAKAYVLYHEELRNALTFEQLKQGLLKRFKKQNSCRFYREQLNTMTQRYNETLESFVDRIRKININTYQLTDSDEANKYILQEAENRALDTFLRGLPPETSRRVRAEFPKTLTEAVNIATALEEIDAATKYKERKNVFSTGVRCFRCDRQGHIAKNCRQPQCSNCQRIGHTYRECRSTGKFANKGPLNANGNPGTATRRSQ